MVRTYEFDKLQFKEDLILILASINNQLARIGDLIQQNAEDTHEGPISCGLYRERLEKNSHDWDRVDYQFVRDERVIGPTRDFIPPEDED